MSSSYASQVIRGAYYPHVDGIRALAVLPVVLYHLSVGLCPGGYSGVDVFFVISGYLIGGGIIRDLRAGIFSFSSFYTRRIKRIMPAYFAMISVALLAGLMLYHYEPLQSLGNAAMRSSYFTANFFCFKWLGDYFAGEATAHPLINLWSLSVEEQFYIIIPLLMWGLWKCCARILPLFLGLLLLLSLVTAEILLSSPEGRPHLQAFYMLVPRAWELLSGVLLAWWCSRRVSLPCPASGWMRGVVAGAGLLMVLVPYILLDQQSHFPGLGALSSVLGCALLILCGMAGPVGRLLESKGMVSLGRISYSLYLWHCPVIVYCRYVAGPEPGMPILTLAFFLSLLLACLSWLWIEMPVRRNRRITFRPALTGLVISGLLIGGLGGCIHQSNGMVHLLHPQANQYASLEFPRTLRLLPEGHWGIWQLRNLKDERGHVMPEAVMMLGDSTQRPDFVLLGDSHAMALQIGLDDLCAEKKHAGLAIAMRSVPLSGVEITNTYSNITEPFLTWLQAQESIRTVIISCWWGLRLAGSSSGQRLYRAGSPVPSDSSGNNALLEEGLEITCKRIREMGKEVVVMGPVPVLKSNPGSEIRRRVILGLPMEEVGESISLQEFNKQEQIVISMLQKLEREGLARIVWIHPVLEQEGAFYGRRDDKLLYHDNNHFSGDGSRYVIRQLYSQLFPPCQEGK